MIRSCLECDEGYVEFEEYDIKTECSICGTTYDVCHTYDESCNVEFHIELSFGDLDDWDY